VEKGIVLSSIQHRWLAGLWLLAACSNSRVVTTEDTVLPAPPPTIHLKLDYRLVFGGRSSSSLYEVRVIDPQLMARVMLEPAVLDDGAEQKPVEAWTRHRLMEGLATRGSLLIAPPLVATVDPRQPCPVGGCYSPPPTAVLHNLRFVSGKDDIRVRVDAPVNGGVTLALWENDKQTSVCGGDFKLKQGFVELLGHVQRISDGALAATIHEVVLLEAPVQAVIEADVPDPAHDAAAFCASVGALFEETPGFARTDGRYEIAAASALEAGLLPLYPHRIK